MKRLIQRAVVFYGLIKYYFVLANVLYNKFRKCMLIQMVKERYTAIPYGDILFIKVLVRYINHVIMNINSLYK